MMLKKLNTIGLLKTFLSDKKLLEVDILFLMMKKFQLQKNKKNSLKKMLKNTQQYFCSWLKIRID